jgi:type IV pilus assembly protein PilW
MLICPNPKEESAQQQQQTLHRISAMRPLARLLHHCAKGRSGNTGFSLVELMIAMTLGLLVVGALTQVYLGGRDVNRIISHAATLNENGRFAMEFFSRDIRLAGYFSCGGAKSDVANALNHETFWFQLAGLEGFDGGETGRAADVLPEIFDSLPTPLPLSDVLVVRYADARRTLLVGTNALDLANKRIKFNQRHPFALGQVAIVNDAACSQTSVFQVVAVGNSAGTGYFISYDKDIDDVEPGNCTNDLAGDYACGDSNRELEERAPADGFRNAQITPLNARAFFIANLPSQQCRPTAVNCPAIANCPTLFTAGADTDGAVPILRDVTDMQILYGIDTNVDEAEPGSGDASVDMYLNAQEVSGQNRWHQVISIKVNIEITSADCVEVPFETTTALRNSTTGTLLAN